MPLEPSSTRSHRLQGRTGFRFTAGCAFFLALLLAVLPFAAAAEESELEADEFEQSLAEDDEAISDPFESWNRGVYWFNDRLDRYLLEPVADGYDAVVPDPVQTGVVNVFENLSYPRYLVSDLVQLKFEQAAEHTGRFLINSTIGLGGLIDVAKHLGLEKHTEDFGTALGHHGVPPGPYLMLPILGPSNFRDGFGRIVDSFLDPVTWVAASTADGDDAVAITLGVKALDVIQTRADIDEALEASKEAALDHYLFLQSAYYQRRRALIEDKQISSEDAASNPFAEDEAFDEEFGEELEEE